jgi:hypothetical protein
MMTCEQPASASIGAETSPVYAPESSQNTSCAPSAIDVLRSASATTPSAVYGGAGEFAAADVLAALDNRGRELVRFLAQTVELPVAGQQRSSHRRVS